MAMIRFLNYFFMTNQKEFIYILQIDTATAVCSVALSKNGQTLRLIEQEGQNIHAEKLTVFIDQILNEEGLKLSDLSAVSISKGPGSYTGLRIGVSTAKGLCFGTELPLIALDSLHSLARGYARQNTDRLSKRIGLCPAIDARRMEVYQTLINSEDLKILEETKAQIVDEETYQIWFEKGLEEIHLFGSGADKFSEMFENNKQVQVIENFKSSAGFMSEESYARFLNVEFENLAYFEPLYLKDFIPTTPRKRL